MRRIRRFIRRLRRLWRLSAPPEPLNIPMLYPDFKLPIPKRSCRSTAGVSTVHQSPFGDHAGIRSRRLSMRSRRSSVLSARAAVAA
jgi:hypothetical protein